MKKSFIFFFILLGMGSILRAQASWFKIYNLGYDSQDAYSLISKKGAVYMMVEGSNFVGNPPLSRGQVVKFDSSGNLVWASFAKFPDCTDWVNVTWEVIGFTVANDNSSYTAGWGLNCDDNHEVIINKFDDNGNLLWMKTYGIPGKKIAVMFEGVTLASDSLGIVVIGAGETGLLALKIDSSGHEVWKHLHDVPVQGQVVGYDTPVVRMPDDSYKVAYHNHVVEAFHDYFVGLDSLGNVESTKTSVFQDESKDLELHPNGNLVYLSLWFDGFPCGGMRVQMLTPQFDTVWTRLFCDTELPNLFFANSRVRNLSIAPDGRILAVGDGANHGALVCYLPDGSLLWKREVAFKGFDNIVVQYATWADDGGILMDGYIYGQRLDSTGQPELYYRAFLTKLDGTGCDVPGCGETITIHNTFTGVQEPVEGNLLIFPNPVNVELFFKIPSGIENLGLKVFNLLGKTVMVQASLKETSIQTGSWPPGIYFLQFSESGRTFQTEKVIIAHP